MIHSLSFAHFALADDTLMAVCKKGIQVEKIKPGLTNDKWIKPGLIFWALNTFLAYSYKSFFSHLNLEIMR